MMLLQRLTEYAASRPDESPPYHRDRVYSWQLELTGEGGLWPPPPSPRC